MSTGTSPRAAALSPGKRALLEKMLAGRAPAAAAPIIPRRTNGGPAPLSFAQQRLWFIHQMDPASAAYNVPCALRLRGALDPAALARSLAEVVRRHESLRTRFEMRPDGPVQIVEENVALDPAGEDLPVLEGEEREAAIERLVRQEASAPFDLSRAPLIRARLVGLAPDDHLFLLTMHHIVSDGWSTGVVVRELASLYEAFAAGRPSPLPALPIQYADFAAWQRERLRGERLDPELAWWKAHLTPLPPALELPTDRARPPAPAFRGGMHPLRLEPDVADALRGLARAQDATLFMVLLAGFDALLARMTGQTDVVVGTGAAGRTVQEVEPLIGFFVNTLVTRVDCSGDPTFRELLGRVREATLGVFAHQEIPFERLVEELHPARDSARNPIFQVLLELQNGPAPPLELPGLSIAPVVADSGAARFDLEIQLTEEPDGSIDGFLVHDTDLFDAETARALVQRYTALLAAVAADPSLRLSRLGLAHGEERARILGAWNDTARDYPRAVTIARLFEEVAAARPDAAALLSEGEAMTYRELLARARRVASALAARGIGPESRVALAMERSPEMIVATLGVLGAGGAYVPIDPDSPLSRTRAMLAGAGVTRVITDGRVGPPGGEIETLPYDDLLAAGGALPHGEFGRGSPANLAYVMFTSGSTGEPKGIEVTQRNVVRLVRGSEYARLGPDETFLHLAPPAFDVATLEIWGPLLCGGRLAIAPPGPASARDIARLLETHKVTILWLTAGLFHLMMDDEPEALARVPQVLAGGDVVSPRHARRLLAAGCPRFVNGYGPTETTTFACCGVFANPDEIGASVPIGGPMANARVYVLGEAMQLLPVGAPGELFIGGDGVARGYARRPAMTAERFVPDPFGEPGARLYRTGDRVRWRRDGQLEFLGRMDGQVKLRGFRVEMAEVEAALAAVPGVRAAAVVAHRDRGETELAGYVAAGGDITARALREALAARLPRPMIPARFVILDALPLTPNGKVDRRALRLPPATPDEAAPPPRTTTERAVAAAWAEVLKVETPGVTDNFFDLGGHSLLATQVVSRLRASLGVEVPLRALFEATTLEALAAMVDTRAGAGAAVLDGKAEAGAPARREGTIPRRGIIGPAPLSFAQQRLWFIDRLAPGAAAYNIPSVLRLRGALDAVALGRALDEIRRRHEALRTRFVETADGARQIVDPAGAAPIQVLDLSGDPEAEETAHRLVAEESTAPFDLSAGPLLRARLIRLAAGDHLFLLTMHHIVSDGWSMGVLVRELADLYEAFAAGRPSPLEELPIQYADFAVWQRSRLSGERLDAELAWWKERLTPLPPPLELPADRPRPPAQTFRGAMRPVRLEPDAAADLRRLAGGQGATLFMVLLAGLDALLARMTGQTDVAVGTGVANRTVRELEPLIGFFVNMLVTRVDCSGDPTFRELLGRVRETAFGAFAHQDLPFERLVEELAPARDLSRNPVFDVAFVFQNTPAASRRVAGLEIGPFPFDSWATRFDLELHMWEGEAGGLDGYFFFDADQYDASTAARLVNRYEALLRAIAHDPDRPLSRLPLAAPGEDRESASLGQGRPLPFAPTLPIRLFEDQAARTPDAPVAVSGERRVTYGALDAASEALAGRLRRAGAGRGARVAVVAGRSNDQVTMVLAASKAGAAYVPLDPAQPRARLASMLERLEATVILAERDVAPGLAAPGRTVLTLDDADDIPTGDAPPGLPLREPRAPGLDDTAYVIFTSGSTGEPNGVEVTHRNLAHLIAWHHDAFGLGPSDRATLVAGVGFDASVWELWPCLAAGGSLHIPDEATRLDPPALRDWIVRQRITIAFLPTPLAEMALALDWPRDAALRILLTGGDRLHAVDPGRHPFRVVNNYGPTETTVVATSGDLDAGGRLGLPTIGRPIANTSARVLDDRMNPVPPGIAGELHVGGPQVARGYLRRPALTAARFLPDPDGPPGARMYRTGDRVRSLADGRLEFLGRADAQVKIRGQRIEPGEIEAVLSAHPDVQAVAVMAHVVDGETRLVAYVSPRSDGGDAARWETEHVARWRDLYEETYRRTPADHDPSFNITGWNSSYTGSPIDPAEMREWRDRTVERILALKPRRVLEIGCGTGLLLTRIAPRCARYVATDLSATSIALLRAARDADPELGHVELLERMADDFEELEPGSFDTIVLNSVVQYFPDAAYLERVIAGALGLLEAGGRLFAGDVRDARLHEAFAASVALHGTAGAPDETARVRARRLIEHEEELLVSPALLAALAARAPQGAWMEALPKEGRADNELTRFRYDAIVHVGTPAPSAPAQDVPWGDDAAARLERLFREGAGAVMLRGIPNDRLVAHVAGARRLLAGEGQARDDSADDARRHRPMHPDDAATLGASHGYEGRSFLSGAGEALFDVLFARPAESSTAPAVPFPAAGSTGPWTNTPVRGTVAASLPPALRAFVSARLPEAMVPSTFIVMDALPVTPNGKIDRRALPLPAAASQAADRVAPRTPVEREMGRIWEEVLGVDRVGVTDSFFELGGHSLLATQLVSRLRSALGVEVPLRAVFETPTLEGLAALVETRTDRSRSSDLIPRRPSVGPAPLSSAQQRLWFIDRLEPGVAAYNIPSLLRLAGDLDVEALRRALEEILRRHETLRTRFVETPDGPMAVVDPHRPFALDVEQAAHEEEAMRRVAEDAARPFDLEAGPPVRARLFRTASAEHLFLLTMHHIVSDGWSMGVLVREIAALYEAFAAGRPSPLPELPIQYADWASWQRGWLEEGEMDRQLAWWRDRLAGVPPIELPTDRPRPALPSHGGAGMAFTLPPPRVQAILRLARVERASLHMALLAAFSATLTRWSGRTDFAIGTPVAGRTRHEVEPLVGFFVNTLALRLRLEEPDLTCRALLRRIRDDALEAYARQDVPFERVVEHVRPPRDTSRNPIFQATFALHNVPVGTLALPGLEIQPCSLDSATARFDLEMQLFEDEEGGVAGRLQWSADLFDRATMERFIRHFERLVETMPDAPDLPLGDIDLRTPGEVERAASVNATRAPRDETTVIALVQRQASLTPASVAVLDEEGSLTYAQLQAHAGRIARDLRAAGIGPEDGVALLAGRSAASVAGILGILESGGVLVPLDAALPVQRIAAMMRDARVRAVVSVRGLRHAIPGNRLPVIPLEGDAAGTVDTRAHGAPPHPRQAAYVIFTSGSTGEPKGSIVEHRALADRIQAMAARYGLGPGDRVLHFFPQLFDASLLEILPPLAAGATVVVHPDPRGETPEQLLDRLRTGGITMATVPVGVLHELADHAGRAQAEIPPTMRILVTGGESPSSPRMAGLLRTARAPLVVLNEYGPTEACILATLHAAATVADLGDPVPIGRPVDNTSVHLLDGRLRPVVQGAVGEICIGGIGLARGYAGRPAETALRFVPDPFSGEPGERLYRTGDLARMRADGAFVFVGRRDGQVKLRGHRIELGEIEAALSRLDGVREAAAGLVGTGPGMSLAAWIVPAPGATLDPQSLRAALRQTIPDIMVPSRIETLERMPRTPTGKLDRRALPAPSEEARRSDHTAPRDDRERAIARVWGKTLGIATVDIHESFFELGGHSLLAARLVGALRRELGAELPLAAFFREPTIAGLSALWRGRAGEQGPGAGGRPALVRIRSGAGLRPVVCFHAAQGGISDFARLASHLDPRRPVYAVHGLDGGAPADVEEAAAFWAGEIGRSLGNGPVDLVGWSYGGLVAFETGRRLRDRGHAMGALLLLDAAPPWDGMEEAAPIGRDALPAEVAESDARAWIAAVEARARAVRSYRPRPWDGDVILVRATESEVVRSHEGAMGWEAWVRGGLTLAWAPGTHDSILEGEGARVVAGILEQHSSRNAETEGHEAVDGGGTRKED